MATAQKKKKKTKTLGFLFTTDAEANSFYQSSITEKIKGDWREAGDKLTRCAELHISLKMMVEAATLYTEAAEAYMKIDISEAIRAYRLSIKTYCDIGRFDVAGKLERTIAYINLRNKHWDDAADNFRKAANFLSGDKLLDQSDICMERYTELLLRHQNYREASKNYEIIATSCVNSNLRRFEVPTYLLKSIVCLLAIPVKDYISVSSIRFSDESVSGVVSAQDTNTVVGNVGSIASTSSHLQEYQTKVLEIKRINDSYGDIDFYWKCCKERLFVQNLLIAALDFESHDFIDHLYHWNQVKPLDKYQLGMLNTCYQELVEEKRLSQAEIEEKEKREAAAYAASRKDFSSTATAMMSNNRLSIDSKSKKSFQSVSSISKE